MEPWTVSILFEVDMVFEATSNPWNNRYYCPVSILFEVDMVFEELQLLQHQPISHVSILFEVDMVFEVSSNRLVRNSIPSFNPI